jgi:hypothetical protein
LSNTPLSINKIKSLNVFIAFSRDLHINHALLNTHQATRRRLAKQSGKGMKKGLSLLVENKLFFADSKALLTSFKIKRVSEDTL